MHTLIYILTSGFLISLASISGVLLVRSNKKIAHFIEENLSLLSALSAGIFLVTSISIGRESFEILGHQSILAFSLGIIFFFILQKFVHKHRHIGNKEKHTHQHNKHSALSLLIGDTIHNIADGLLLVASFGSSTVVGISTAFSIFIHETPQEISEFIVLKKSGYSTTEAAYRNFATAISIFIGIGIGYVFLETIFLQAWLLGISAAFFIGIIFTDLLPIPYTLRQKNKKQIFLVFLIGIVIMFGITTSLGHQHEHGDEQQHEHTHPQHEHAH